MARPDRGSLSSLTVVLEMFQFPLGNEPNSGLQFFRHIDFAGCAVYTSIYSDLDVFCEINMFFSPFQLFLMCTETAG